MKCFKKYWLYHNNYYSLNYLTVLIEKYLRLTKNLPKKKNKNNLLLFDLPA